MKCPLIAIGYLASNRIDATEKCICGEQECGRWDKRHGICGDLLEAQACDRIANYLEAIVDKMPHEGQFRK